MAATKTIPIVFVTASDPVGAAFVTSLGRPGGNVTGITLIGVELVAKRMELLREVLPGATRIALLVNPNNPGLMQDNIQHSEAAVKRLGLEISVIKAGSESEIESAVIAAVQQQANAMSIGADAYLNSRSRQISSFALRHALPTLSESRESVANGLLMSYGPSQVDAFRQAGLYVGHILKGQKPADLPVFATDEVRAGDQSHDRQGNRAENPGILSRPRRRGDRLGGCPCCDCSQPVMALNGHAGSHQICPLLKVDRTCHRATVTAPIDPGPDMSGPLLLRCHGPDLLYLARHPWPWGYAP
jgi:hypothetical protein